MNIHDILYPLVGGSLIGLAAVILLIFLGRVAGISGILSSLLLEKPKTWFSKPHLWRLGFLGGLISVSVLIGLLPAGDHIPSLGSHSQLIIAGLLVGLGTALANGCTSGHGVCGLARLSKRSLIAVCLFMLTAMATVECMYIWKLL